MIVLEDFEEEVEYPNDEQQMENIKKRNLLESLFHGEDL